MGGGPHMVLVKLSLDRECVSTAEKEKKKKLFTTEMMFVYLFLT